MLKDKWALVTGATAGLGLAVAESLAGAGANIVLHDLVEPKQTRDGLRSRFDVEVVSVAADLSQRSSIETMMADLLGRSPDRDPGKTRVQHFAPVKRLHRTLEQALAVNLSAALIDWLDLPAMKNADGPHLNISPRSISTRAVAAVSIRDTRPPPRRPARLRSDTTSGLPARALPGPLPTPAIKQKIAESAPPKAAS